VATPSRPQSITLEALHNAQKSLSAKIYFPPLNRVGEIFLLCSFLLSFHPASQLKALIRHQTKFYARSARLEIVQENRLPSREPGLSSQMA
jgi:hypothetical protein